MARSSDGGGMLMLLVFGVVGYYLYQQYQQQSQKMSPSVFVPGVTDATTFIGPLQPGQAPPVFVGPIQPADTSAPAAG